MFILYNSVIRRNPHVGRPRVLNLVPQVAGHGEQRVIVRPAGVLAVYLLSTSGIDHFPRGGFGLYSDSGSILYLLSTNENFVTKFCVSHFSASAPTGE